MKNLHATLTVEQIEDHWVVVDRQMWEDEHPTALLSLMGSSRLAAGPFATKDEAKVWHERLVSA